MNKHIKFAFMFLSISAAGIFVSMAGGIEWGTLYAGMMAFCTILAASTFAGLVSYGPMS